MPRSPPSIQLRTKPRRRTSGFNQPRAGTRVINGERRLAGIAFLETLVPHRMNRFLLTGSLFLASLMTTPRLAAAESRLLAPGARVEKLGGGYEFTEGPAANARGEAGIVGDEQDQAALPAGAGKGEAGGVVDGPAQRTFTLYWRRLGDCGMCPLALMHVPDPAAEECEVERGNTQRFEQQLPQIHHSPMTRSS